EPPTPQPLCRCPPCSSCRRSAHSRPALPGIVSFGASHYLPASEIGLLLRGLTGPRRQLSAEDTSFTSPSVDITSRLLRGLGRLLGDFADLCPVWRTRVPRNVPTFARGRTPHY